MSFTPSDELAVEGRRLRTATADPAAGHPQSRAAVDGLSEEEKKLHKLLVRGEVVAIVTLRPSCGREFLCQSFPVFCGVPLRRVGSRDEVAHFDAATKNIIAKCFFAFQMLWFYATVQ